MFSTSHLPPSLPQPLFLSYSHAHALFLCLSPSVMLFVILSFFLSSEVSICFFFVSFISLFFSSCDIFFLVTFCIRLSLMRPHANEHTHTHTRACGQTCVVESEKVSVLFSGQLGLIFSTFCFHTLTDSPQAETERESEAHTERKQRHHSLNAAFRDFTMTTGVCTHSRAQTGSGGHTSESETQQLFSVSHKKTAKICSLVAVN